MNAGKNFKHKNRLRGLALWIIGLPASGKTTLATALEKHLSQMGLPSIHLDGDIMRSGLNSDLSFELEDREENIRRAAEVAKIATDNGLICICSFITPTLKIQNLVKSINEPNCRFIFLNTSLEECKKRDPKGLYKKAMSGEIKNFTGIDSPFEPPINPHLTFTEKETLEAMLDAIEKGIIKPVVG